MNRAYTQYTCTCNAFRFSLTCLPYFLLQGFEDEYEEELKMLAEDDLHVNPSISTKLAIGGGSSTCWNKSNNQQHLSATGMRNADSYGGCEGSNVHSTNSKLKQSSRQGTFHIE